MPEIKTIARFDRHKVSSRTMTRHAIALLLAPLIASLLPTAHLRAQSTLVAKFPLERSPIELARRARPQIYFDAIGRRSAIIGRETSRFEAWVFPLKLFHDARLQIAIEGRDEVIDFAERVDRIIVRPESTTIVASDQLFTISATFFSPIDTPGSIILLDIDTDRPLRITVSFAPDLRPMWPGGFGGQTAGWRADLNAFLLSESRRKYNGIFGSPAATRGISTPAHELAEGGLRFEMRIDPALARRFYYPLFIAGGIDGREATIARYRSLAASVEAQYQKTRAHYLRLRDERLRIRTPDPKFDLAFEWAKVALDKGMIDNPELGLGLVAGWGRAGSGARPGFGWYFGGDMAINSLAMTGYGDFEMVRAALDFAARYQRRDGKVPHEVSQAAAQIRWFDEYPYAYYHADTTPLFIIAAHALYKQSGAQDDIRRLWPALKSAFEFCRANDSDGDGILENSRAGLGASELGSLLSDLHQDIYLAATNTEASRAMAEMSLAMGEADLARDARARHELGLKSISTRYYSAEARRYAYALTKSGKQNLEVTAWSALPLVFGQMERESLAPTLALLASSELSTDWGARMLSRNSPDYDPIAYNNGGVWPFLTGFVSLAEYRYSRPLSGFAHLRQLAQLSHDFALGYNHEILSGEHYRPLQESVPHQLFSSSMVITPFLRGMLGIAPEAARRRLRLAPQLPPSWKEIEVENIPLGSARVSLRAERNDYSRLRYLLGNAAPEPIEIELEIALPHLARVSEIRLNRAATRCAEGVSPSTCRLELRLEREAEIDIRLEGGIEIELPYDPPEIGARSESLKLLETRAQDRAIEIDVEGLAGRTYRLLVRSGRRFAVERGARIAGEENGWLVLGVDIPPAGGERRYVSERISLRLVE